MRLSHLHFLQQKVDASASKQRESSGRQGVDSTGKGGVTLRFSLCEFFIFFAREMCFHLTYFLGYQYHS